jgi:hypothetical protein
MIFLLPYLVGLFVLLSIVSVKILIQFVSISQLVYCSVQTVWVGFIEKIRLPGLEHQVELPIH